MLVEIGLGFCKFFRGQKISGLQFDYNRELWISGREQV